MVDQWKRDLQKEVRDSMQKNIQSPTPNKISKIKLRPFLLFVVLILLVSNLFAFETKYPGCIKSRFDQFFSESEEEKNFLSVALKDLDARLAALELGANVQIKSELQDLRDKVLLIAIVVDENAAISKEILGRCDHRGKEFVHIGPDWNIDKMPSHLSLSPETKRFLEKRLK